MTEESPGLVEKFDDDRVLDQSMNGTMKTVAHVAADAPEQPEQGAVAMPCLVESKIPNPKSKIEGLPEKVQNKPNLEFRKEPVAQEIQPETIAADGREQSQFRRAVTVGQWPVRTEWPVTWEWPVVSEDAVAVNAESAIENPESQESRWGPNMLPGHPESSRTLGPSEF